MNYNAHETARTHISLFVLLKSTHLIMIMICNSSHEYLMLFMYMLVRHWNQMNCENSFAFWSVILLRVLYVYTTHCLQRQWFWGSTVCFTLEWH